MITVEVRTELREDDAAEVAAMVAEAAAYDEEAGFSTVEPGLDPDTHTEIFHVLSRLTPGLHGSSETPLAAYLRLAVDRAGGAAAQMVVRPPYRSLGIATLTLETLGELAGEGWAGTGAVSITCWANGDHPAAERMSRRFGADIEAATWKLLRGAETLVVDAADESAVLRARHEGFVHEQTDVRYVWRVPVPAVTEPTA